MQAGEEKREIQRKVPLVLAFEMSGVDTGGNHRHRKALESVRTVSRGTMICFLLSQENRNNRFPSIAGKVGLWEILSSVDKPNEARFVLGVRFDWRGWCTDDDRGPNCGSFESVSMRPQVNKKNLNYCKKS